MESCRQQSIKTRRSDEPQGPSLTVSLAPRRALQETNSNPQIYAPETTNLEQAKLTAAFQPTIASILEQRRKVRSHARQLYPVQRVQQYQQYRAGQRARQQDVGSKGDPVWPDELEDAFIEALYKVPPIGRRKLSIHRKPCGRNELISEYILKRTGVRRCRKQVSSHIQVLKGFMHNEPEFMKLVTSKEPLSALDENPFPNEEMTRLFIGDDCLLDTGEGDLPSNGPSSITQSAFTDWHLASSAQAGVWPLAFAIWLQDSDQDAVLERSLHTYTSLVSGMPLPPTSLESLRNWRSRFPHLATLHQDGAVNSQIFLFNVSFNTMAVLPSFPAFLCTQSEVTSSDTYACHTWKCTTKIYKHGKLVADYSQKVSQFDSPDGTSKLVLPFASNFWSATFTTTFNVTGQYPKSHLSGEDMEDDEALLAIRGISVVQELFATSVVCQSVPKRVALFLWEFNKAMPGEAGNATWRSLIPPPCRILTNSPSPGRYAELNSTSSESSIAPAIEHWESTATPSTDLSNESYIYDPVDSSLEIMSNPTYYMSLSHGMTQESIQASLGDTGPLSYIPYDSSVPFVPDDPQQYMSQWQQYPSPFSDSHFPIAIPY